MAIRINDNSSNFAGRVSSTLGVFSANFDGTFTSAGDVERDGALQRALGGFRTVFTQGAKRWHPGHYVKTQGNHARSDEAAYIQGVKNDLDNVNDLGLLKGALVQFSWGRLNPTGSTFDWSTSDDIFDYITANAPGQDKLMIELTWKAFTGSISNAVIGPADLLSAHRQQTNSGYTMAIYRDVVRDRYLEFITAFANRYRNDERLELVTTAESAPSYGTAFVPPDYTRAQLAAAYNSISQHFSIEFPNTNASININSLSGELRDMLETAYQNGIGMHSPDVTTSTAEQLFVGVDAGGESPVRNYTGLISHSTIVSQPVLDPIDGKDYVGPPADIIVAAGNYAVTHLAWVTNESAPGHTWSDIQTAITANPNTLWTDCPTQYSSCDLT